MLKHIDPNGYLRYIGDHPYSHYTENPNDPSHLKTQHERNRYWFRWRELFDVHPAVLCAWKLDDFDPSEIQIDFTNETRSNYCERCGIVFF